MGVPFSVRHRLLTSPLSQEYIGDDVFDPLWEELDRRAAVVFLHGAQVPSSTPYPHPYLGIPVTEVSCQIRCYLQWVPLTRVLSYFQVPNETFKAAAHLVVSGKKRRFPNVKIILTHFGGVTPFLAPRIAVLSKHMGCPLSHEEILEDFKSFYFDTALSTHETTLAAMQTFVGPDRILFGSDFPGAAPSISVGRALGLTASCLSSRERRDGGVVYTEC